MRHVDGHRALVAVARGVIARLIRRFAIGIVQKRRAPVSCIVARAGAFDLDHVGAQIGQNLGTPRPREDSRQIQYSDTAQSSSLR